MSRSLTGGMFTLWITWSHSGPIPRLTSRAGRTVVEAVPAAPCEKGYLIGWVIDKFGRPIKYDGLIGEAIIRNSGTAFASYRGITVQAEGTTAPGDVEESSGENASIPPD